jgi:hypothetical protein
LFGPEANRNSLPQNVSPTRPNAASSAASATGTISADLLRARWLLHDVLMREDVTEEVLLLDEVRDGLDQVCRTLEHLAGQQHLFEFWRVEMKK